MKKIAIVALGIIACSGLNAVNWIIWFRNESPYRIEAASITPHANHLSTLKGERDWYKDVFEIPAVTGGPGSKVEFQARSFPFPWGQSGENLYMTVYKPEGPVYWRISENNVYSGFGDSYQRMAIIHNESANLQAERIKIGDNWELTIVIGADGTPRVRGKNFETLP